ncbi:MAG: glycerate kinase [Acidobacteria bacterium]|nr:glycerate kinase [Acidobacteriota bacterium]
MKPLRVLRSDAANIWTAALQAVDPEAAVRKYVRRRKKILQVEQYRFDLDTIRNVWILGAGKAAAPMGKALEKILGKYLSGGFLTTKYEHGLALKKIDIMEAGHPLPDKNSLASAERIHSFVENRVEPGDLVICVFSGGASSLVVSPADGITLEDKLRCSEILMNAGASIHELNSVRKHLSRLKGGGLARLLSHAGVVVLALSDVVGDDIATIASGPSAPDPTTFSDCMEVFQKLGISDRIPPAVLTRMEQGCAGRLEETAKPGDPVFRGSRFLIVGNSALACTAALKAAKRMGYRSMVLTSRLEGDNESAARFHMGILKEVVQQDRPLRRPACIISGGETTVNIAGNGRGGRNQEFALHCVPYLAGLQAPALVASLGTDGTDGPTDAAGAVADNSTLTRSLKYGPSFLKESLGNNDSYTFFKRLGDLIITGPTRTNVMDLHIVLVG